MKPAVPWSVKGVEPDAREAAKRAARSAGMTLGAWLNQKLLESEGANFGATSGPSDAGFVGDWGTQPQAQTNTQPEPQVARQRRDIYAPQPTQNMGPDMGAVTHTLDALQHHLREADARSERTFGQISNALEAVLAKLDRAGERSRTGLSADATDSLLAIKSALGDMTQRLSAVENRTAPNQDLGHLERSVMEIGRAFETATLRTSQRIDQVENTVSKFADRSEQAELRRTDAVRSLEGAVTELAVSLNEKTKDNATALRETQRDIDDLHRSFADKKSNEGLGESRLAASMDALQGRISDLASQVEDTRKSVGKSVTEKDLGKLERRLGDATALAIEHATARAITQDDLAALDARLQQNADKAITSQDLATLEGRMAGVAKTTVQDAMKTLQTSLRGELLERVDAAEARSADAIHKLQKNEEELILGGGSVGRNLADLESTLGNRLEKISSRLESMATEFDARLDDHRTGTRRELEALRGNLGRGPVDQRQAAPAQQQSAPQAPPAHRQAGGYPAPSAPGQAATPLPPTQTQQTPQGAQARAGGAQPYNPDDYMASARAAVRDSQSKPFVAERPGSQAQKQPVRGSVKLIFAILVTIGLSLGGTTVWREYQQNQELGAEDVYDPNAQGELQDAPARSDQPSNQGTDQSSSTTPVTEDSPRVTVRDTEELAQVATAVLQPTETLQSRNPVRDTSPPEPQTSGRRATTVVTPPATRAPDVQRQETTTRPTSPRVVAPTPTELYTRAVTLLERPSTSNNRAAAEQLRRAADQGLTIAQYRLATLYEAGRGVEQDDDLALAWYTQSAEGGNVRAMHNVAVVHAEGLSGGPPDFAEAARWFAEAASYGVRDSQFNLAVLFERGLGVRRDVNQAYLWYSIAEAGGDPEAGSRRTTLNQQIEPSARRQIDSAVADWRARPLDGEANGRIPASRPSGANVAQIATAQRILTSLGYDPGPSDGLMGPRTADSIRQFELTAGMTITGRVSPELISRLEAELSARANNG